MLINLRFITRTHQEMHLCTFKIKIQKSYIKNILEALLLKSLISYFKECETNHDLNKVHL